MTDDLQPEINEPELAHATAPAEPVAEEPMSETAPEDSAEPEAEDADKEAAEAEDEPAPRPPAKLERLQKILAQAGVASRRSAEGMITQGRVQVNGKVVTELGTKADAARDHIRVDGKLLHGAERLRYFMLNKPRGFVTTVKDPEGRPTVMQFFEKLPERLYPVGRLDYLSEGLLLVTNDGELANKLTKAASGVEKTYLVKVSGQPTEDELNLLRGGVSIERGKPGSGQVRTSPARVRQVRQGDNPWYEVVLIEGRNRELRKMFEEIGHFVEKIRRVGYGPLVLDVEPGHLRELQAEELDLLRKTSEGKLRTPKSKELRRRNAMDAAGLPTVAPRPTARPRPSRPAEDRPAASRPAASHPTGDYGPKKSFGAPRGSDRPFRPTRPEGEGFRPAPGRGPDRSAAHGPVRSGPARSGPARSGSARPDDRPRRTGATTAKFGPGRPSERPTDRPTPRPAWKKDGPAGRGSTPRPGGSKPAWGKPVWSKPSGDRPAFNRPAPRREAPAPAEDLAPTRPPRLHIEAVEPERPGTRPARPSRPGPDRGRPDRARPDRARPDRPRVNESGADRPRFDKARSDRPRFDKPQFDKPRFGEPRPDKPRPDKPGFDRPRAEAAGRGRSSGPARGGERPYSAPRPPRREGGLARPFTTSSGQPRPGGARPSSKPGGTGSGGRSKPAFGAKPGVAGKSGYKGKPSGGSKRSGPRPGGKRPGKRG